MKQILKDSPEQPEAITKAIQAEKLNFQNKSRLDSGIKRKIRVKITQHNKLPSDFFGDVQDGSILSPPRKRKDSLLINLDSRALTRTQEATEDDTPKFRSDFSEIQQYFNAGKDSQLFQVQEKQEFKRKISIIEDSIHQYKINGQRSLSQVKNQYILNSQQQEKRQTILKTRSRVMSEDKRSRRFNNNFPLFLNQKTNESSYNFPPEESLNEEFRPNQLSSRIAIGYKNNLPYEQNTHANNLSSRLSHIQQNILIQNQYPTLSGEQEVRNSSESMNLIYQNINQIIDNKLQILPEKKTTFLPPLNHSQSERQHQFTQLQQYDRKTKINQNIQINNKISNNNFVNNKCINNRIINPSILYEKSNLNKDPKNFSFNGRFFQQQNNSNQQIHSATLIRNPKNSKIKSAILQELQQNIHIQ